MKLLLEHWREYLKEAENSFPYQIYCDMDGVLVDLVGAVLKTANEDADDEALRKKVTTIIGLDIRWTEKHAKYQKGLDYINSMVSDDIDFWADLPPTPDKDTLWNFIAPYNPNILSHPWDQASSDGKILWVEEYLSCLLYTSPSPRD